jgi:hypothetical protein
LPLTAVCRFVSNLNASQRAAASDYSGLPLTAVCRFVSNLNALHSGQPLLHVGLVSATSIDSGLPLRFPFPWRSKRTAAFARDSCLQSTAAARFSFKAAVRFSFKAAVRFSFKAAARFSEVSYGRAAARFSFKAAVRYVF